MLLFIQADIADVPSDVWKGNKKRKMNQAGMMMKLQKDSDRPRENMPIASKEGNIIL